MFRKLSREILDGLDIKYKEVFAAEIYLEEKIFPLVCLQRKFNAAGVPRYPGITRDITLPVKSEVAFEEISAAIYGLKETLLTNVGFQDCYEGEKAPQDTKRITISLHYGSSERTLTEEEVAPAHIRLVQALEAKFQIKIA
jgi:phenylalanyl-tRNA synthetase beta chain